MITRRSRRSMTRRKKRMMIKRSMHLEGVGHPEPETVVDQPQLGVSPGCVTLRHSSWGRQYKDRLSDGQTFIRTDCQTFKRTGCQTFITTHFQTVRYTDLRLS